MKKQYKLVSGDNEVFESEINRLYGEGYMPSSNITVIQAEGGLYYSMIMQYCVR